MADESTTIKQLKDAVARFEQERDWRKFHSPKNLAMGIAIETGELLEHFQWISGAESFEVAGDAEQMEQVRQEIADVFCYLLNLALVMGVDLSDAFWEKMEINGAKYPVEKYRGRYKIDE